MVLSAGMTANRYGALARWAWPGLGLLLVVAGYFLFADSIVRILRVYHRPEFSHGYIIPLISAWLIWQRRQLIWKLRERGAPGGWLLVAGGAAIVLFAAMANVDSLPYLGLLPCLIGLTAAMFGWRSARLVTVPVLFLGFGFPLPNTAYIQLSTTLQLLSSGIGAGILHALGIPVFLEGNIIDLGTFKLQVAEACSGLRYLLPLLSFGVLCAYMYRAPLWAKILVVAMTIPLTVLLNGVRIAMTGIFVELGSEESAQGFMHLFEGWVVFLVALAFLFGLMWLLVRLRGERCAVVDLLDFDRMAGAPGGRAPERLATAVPIAETAPAVVPRALLWSVATMVVAAALLLPIQMRPQHVPERPGLLTYPLQLKNWDGSLRWLDATTKETLGARDYLLADFMDAATGDRVNLWVAYYDSLVRDGAQIHMPTTCLPGAGWEFVQLDAVQTPFRDFAGDPLTVSRAVIALGTERILMYFWLELRGHHAIGQKARLRNLWESVLYGRSDGALVRILTPLDPGETSAEGDVRLLRFLELGYPYLEPHVGA